MAKGQLNNATTRFGRFKWGEDDQIRRAIAEVREKMAAQGKPLPIRFKVKLGREFLGKKAEIK